MSLNATAEVERIVKEIRALLIAKLGKLHTEEKEMGEQVYYGAGNK